MKKLGYVNQGICMSDLFKGFEQLLEIAKVLEEKMEKGELKTDVQINTRNFSSIPRQGNIPVGTSRIQTHSPASSPVPDDVIVTPPPASASLKDIGGLSTVLKELREVVEIPLKRPDLLTKLGLEAPRGVLLVGPPGSPKNWV
jgi:transitional endoplasmic reticulum ATPase